MAKVKKRLRQAVCGPERDAHTQGERTVSCTWRGGQARRPATDDTKCTTRAAQRGRAGGRAGTASHATHAARPRAPPPPLSLLWVWRWWAASSAVTVSAGALCPYARSLRATMSYG
jgi:hypothetical protein